MKKRLFKGLAAALTTVLCMLPLSACGSSQENWDGTYYKEIDETHFYAFEITVNSEGEDSASVFISRLDCEIHEDGSYGTAGGGWSAYLENDGSGDDGNYLYKLRGDVLTVTAADKDDDYAVRFEGKYTRGEPMPDPDLTEGGLRLHTYYLLDGDPDAPSLLFYDDEVALIGGVDDDGSRETEYAPYTVDGDTITVSAEGEDFTLELQEDESLSTEDGYVFLAEE